MTFRAFHFNWFNLELGDIASFDTLPNWISEEERDLIIEGMLASIAKIFEEVNKSKDI